MPPSPRPPLSDKSAHKYFWLIAGSSWWIEPKPARIEPYCSRGSAMAYNVTDDARVFQQLVDDCGLAGQVRDYHFVSGLLLALASGPELVAPSEWMELIYVEDEPPAVGDKAAFGELFGHLMLLWNHWNDAIESPDEILDLPIAYCLDSAGEPSPELSDFALGVVQGYGWLEQDWQAVFETLGAEDTLADAEDLFANMLMSAMLLSNPQAVREMVESEGEEPPTSAEALEFFPAGLKFLARFGRIMSDPEMMEPEQPHLNPDRDVGRNDPCPCGSGKKYKKCCLN